MSEEKRQAFEKAKEKEQFAVIEQVSKAAVEGEKSAFEEVKLEEAAKAKKCTCSVIDLICQANYVSVFNHPTSLCCRKWNDQR